MPPRLNWILGVSLALFMTLSIYFYYRHEYATHKRVRVVTDGKLYRSGCLTVDGFEDAIKKYGIRTVINLQEEAPDPDLPKSYWNTAAEKESDLCKRLGVKYVFMLVDLQPPEKDQPPEAIAAFRAIVDEPKNHPILLHCRAGLHRTGVLVANYRMNYDGWSVFQALQELRGHGFGRSPSYAPNEYIRQYVVDFRPSEPATGSTPGTLTSRTKN